MTLFTKSISILILILLIAGPTISTSANIIDDFQKNFQTQKSRVKESVREFKTQSEIDADEQISNLSKICEIRKGYAVKHYTSRQEKRSKEIDEGLPNIAKIRQILVNTKQDLTQLNAIADNLSNSMKQKKDLLAGRIKNTEAIVCKDQTEGENSREKVRINNSELMKLNKNISNLKQDFGFEVRRLIESIKQSAKDAKSSEIK
jgi:hypothetical protein